MAVIYLQIFVSLSLVVGSLLMFAFSTRKGDAEHAERLSLIPFEDEKKS
jgi:hypothetical protein